MESTVVTKMCYLELGNNLIHEQSYRRTDCACYEIPMISHVWGSNLFLRNLVRHLYITVS